MAVASTIGAAGIIAIAIMITDLPRMVVLAAGPIGARSMNVRWRGGMRRYQSPLPPGIQILRAS